MYSKKYIKRVIIFSSLGIFFLGLGNFLAFQIPLGRIIQQLFSSMLFGACIGIAIGNYLINIYIRK